VNAIFTYLYPYFSSPLAWYYQHVVGHHLYPNIKGKDPDLNNASPLHRYMSWHRFRYENLYYYYYIAIPSTCVFRESFAGYFEIVS
jgi:delta11-fatty-acid desaturase